MYLGWAFDSLFLPKEIVVSMYQQVRKMGIKLITTHVAKNAVFGRAISFDVTVSYLFVPQEKHLFQIYSKGMDS